MVSLGTTAGAQVTKQLNKRCYEYDECKLFVKAVDRMTNNERQGRHQFRQGQIAVVEQLVGHGMQMGRRTHYPVRFYISTTKHCIQGETLALAATQIKDSSREYRL